jgi:hypothetical protein
MQQKAHYLGHIIGPNGISMDPAKIETITKWPEIKSIKQLQAFLGLVGYYRRFIAKFADVAKPLTNLLKQQSVSGWTTEQDVAVQTLIEKVTRAPILQTPDYNKPFMVTTDASDVALGGVLSQESKPVAFLSKTFSDTETRWTIYEKELFAVVYALRKWEHYLLSDNMVTIITDNNAVSHIQQQTKITPKQAQWLSYMGTFNYTINHRPGVDNKVADAISCRDIFGITEISNQHWIDHLRKLSQKMPKQEWMTIQNDLIYKKNRLYVPGYEDIRKLIIEEIHQGMGGRHLGYKKTLEKVTRNYYWEKMAESINKFVQSCETCQ